MNIYFSEFTSEYWNSTRNYILGPSMSTYHSNLIFNDYRYGMNNPDKLYKWYKAIKYGNESQYYREILEYFT
jgi:nuclear transport factor 2 (NTF2) superfamily protein